VDQGGRRPPWRQRKLAIAAFRLRFGRVRRYGRTQAFACMNFTRIFRDTGMVCHKGQEYHILCCSHRSLL